MKLKKKIFVFLFFRYWNFWFCKFFFHLIENFDQSMNYFDYLRVFQSKMILTPCCCSTCREFDAKIAKKSSKIDKNRTSFASKTRFHPFFPFFPLYKAIFRFLFEVFSEICSHRANENCFPQSYCCSTVHHFTVRMPYSNVRQHKNCIVLHDYCTVQYSNLHYSANTVLYSRVTYSTARIQYCANTVQYSVNTVQ